MRPISKRTLVLEVQVTMSPSLTVKECIQLIKDTLNKEAYHPDTTSGSDKSPSDYHILDEVQVHLISKTEHHSK